MSQTACTFVTGYPEHLLARNIVRQLVKRDETPICCLVEERFLSDADRDLASIAGDAAERVEFIVGDPVAMDFSLSGKDYLALAARIQTIHHCAARFFLGSSRKDAKLGTLTATREVVELAEKSSGLKRCVHWSTALVSGNRRGLIREDELSAQNGFRNSLEEMHFRAERLMRNLSERLPVVILRPSILTGNSKTGEMDRGQGFFQLVRLLLNAPAEFRIPLPALGDSILNLVPVDYVAKAGCHIANQPQAIGKTFHLTDPRALSAKKVFALISENTGRRVSHESLAGDLLGAVLQIPGMQRIAPVPRAFLQQALTEVNYDSRQADVLLEETGIECPPFESYVRQLVDFVKQQREKDKAA